MRRDGRVCPPARTSRASRPRRIFDSMRGPTPRSGMTVGEGLFGPPEADVPRLWRTLPGGCSTCSIFDCGVSFFILSVGFWAGDGRSGTRMQDDYGTYAETKSIGGCPAIPYTHALGDLPASRASLRGDIRSPQQRSTAERDGLSARCRRGRMEPHKGTKALHNESEDSRNSSARVKSARRIRPDEGRRIGKGVDREA